MDAWNEYQAIICTRVHAVKNLKTLIKYLWFALT